MLPHSTAVFVRSQPPNHPIVYQPSVTSALV